MKTKKKNNQMLEKAVGKNCSYLNSHFHAGLQKWGEKAQREQH